MGTIKAATKSQSRLSTCRKSIYKTHGAVPTEHQFRVPLCHGLKHRNEFTTSQFTHK